MNVSIEISTFTGTSVPSTLRGSLVVGAWPKFLATSDLPIAALHVAIVLENECEASYLRRNSGVLILAYASFSSAICSGLPPWSGCRSRARFLYTAWISSSLAFLDTPIMA